MSLDQDVTAARRAVDDLEQACAQVTRHFRDTVDARRLRVDVARLRDDLTLLCGGPPAQGHRQPSATVWDDGFDADFGVTGRTAP